MGKEPVQASILARVASWIIIGSGLAVTAADYLEIGKIVPFALVALGVGLILGGIQARREGYVLLQSRTRPRAPDSPDDDGIPPSTWGIVLMAAGVTVLGAVLFFGLGLDRRVLGWAETQAQTRVGGALIIVAMCLVGVAWGAGLIVKESRPGVLWFVLSLPYRAGGIVLILVSMAILVGALITILQPEQLDLYKTGLWNWLTGWLQ